MITSAATGPAGVIREYLEQTGSVEVPFHHLLTSWKIDEPTTLDRQKMADQLRAAGVEPGLPLGELAPDDVVTLTLGAPSATPAVPPWLRNGAAHDQPTPVVVPSVPPEPGPSDGRRRRGRRRLRIAFAILGLLAVVAGAATGAYFVGQDTRQSDDQVQRQLESLAAHDKRVYTRREDASLVAQERSLNRERRAAVARARKNGRESGYASGRTEGYSAGNQAGYSSGHATGQEEGHAAGVEDGIEQGSDELTCSDDLDVPLPACDF